MKSAVPIVFAFVLAFASLLLSRIREQYDRGLSTEDAVSHGIKSTAGVVMELVPAGWLEWLPRLEHERSADPVVLAQTGIR